MHTHTHELKRTLTYITFWAWVDKAFKCVQAQNVGSKTFRYVILAVYVTYSESFIVNKNTRNTCMYLKVVLLYTSSMLLDDAL